MITQVVLFGAAGDLAGRFVLPALAGLGEVRVVGADAQEWDDDAFRRHVADRLGDRAPAAFLAGLSYVRVDATRPQDVARAVRRADRAPLAVYLALPQRVFLPAISGLARAGLPAGSRVAVEKPFGADLEEALVLNALLDEHAFRVDHVLGMPKVQELLARRLAGEAPEDVAEVEILWEETLALEGRAGFYDRAGALKDVLQNHMLQLLAIVAMEPPASVEEVRDRKMDVLRATRALRSARARYAGYAEEAGVDPARGTETFVEVLLEVDTPRWAGTTFRMRAGKGLGHGFKGAILHPRGGDPVRFEADRLGEGEPPAYARVLRDVLSGGSTLSVRADEAEAAWRIVTPVLDDWAAGKVTLEEYPVGSAGPPAL
jgi:glucose-6-phosphate 1-dehydrogenase